jgi:exopolysaccharide biosynthesis polyprenyl glycosylphosphotransferase
MAGRTVRDSVYPVKAEPATGQGRGRGMASGRDHVSVTVEAERSAEPDTGLAPPGRWWTGYGTRLIVTDAVAVYIAIFTAYVLRIDTTGVATVNGDLSPSYLLVSVLLMWGWLTALVLGRTQDRRVVGSGPMEYQRVVSVSWKLFAAVAVFAYLFRMEIGRGFLAIAFPLGLSFLLLGRFSWRQWLHNRRRIGKFHSRVLVCGHKATVERAIEELRSHSDAGFGVVGVCLPAREITSDRVADTPVYGSLDEAAEIARAIGVDAVTVVGSDGMTAEAVRRLGWDLEGTGIDLALTLSVRDVAGPRVIMQPVNGLPLVYVDPPQFTGPKYVAKSAFDWVGALVIMVALSPLLTVIAALVKITSTGPVIYRQERTGVNGVAFDMLKFRSMSVDAHERLGEVLAADGVDEVGVFYKPKNDPRVTPLGRFLRRYSLDELPQLFNVLRGDMSLVGPRPQIAAEVAQYDRRAARRLLVKPGLTGLWQVSGRSDLSAQEGIRMDVDYVENWSLFGDVLILLRTLKVVVTGEGTR